MTPEDVLKPNRTQGMRFTPDEIDAMPAFLHAPPKTLVFGYIGDDQVAYVSGGGQLYGVSIGQMPDNTLIFYKHPL